MPHTYRLFPVTALVLLALLGGCSKSENAEKKETQVIAKVNGDEISVHQLNFQLARVGQKLDEAQSKAASRQLLSRLVDQQLVVQKAMESKLDRDPKILQAIENAKREILAQSYIEQQIATAKKPTEQEISDFYSKHPELFEKRRIYRLQEISVQATPEQVGQIEAAMKNAKNVGEVGQWLKSKNIPFSANANVRAAEQLPLELLPRLNQMKDGEAVLVRNQAGVNIIALAASQEQPVAKDKATPMIEQYFLNQRKSEVAKKTMETLRAAAKIEYLGEFADMKTTEAKAVESAKPAEAAKAEPAKAEAAPAPVKPATNDASLQKGISGL